MLDDHECKLSERIILYLTFVLGCMHMHTHIISIYPPAYISYIAYT